MNCHIEVDLLEIAGYKSAVKGLSLMRRQPVDAMPKVCRKLANLDHGHNKYLEHIQIWLLVSAPRYWWQEADTYRHSSKQSESTMWDFRKDNVSEMTFDEFKEMFEAGDVSEEYYYEMITISREMKNNPDMQILFKRKLMEGFIQTREWTFNLKTFREMIIQRLNHRLPHWKIFLSSIYKSLPKECRDILGIDSSVTQKLLRLSIY